MYGRRNTEGTPEENMVEMEWCKKLLKVLFHLMRMQEGWIKKI